MVIPAASSDVGVDDGNDGDRQGDKSGNGEGRREEPYDSLPAIRLPNGAWCSRTVTRQHFTGHHDASLRGRGSGLVAAIR